MPFPQMNDPLLNGQVDAVVQVEPFRSALMATGKAEIISWTYVETAPKTDITQYLALTSWVENNHDAAIKFARAVIKGAAFAKANDAAAREINAAYTKLNPAFKDKVLLPELRNCGERCRNEPHDGTDAEVRDVAEAGRYFGACSETTLNSR